MNVTTQPITDYRALQKTGGKKKKSTYDTHVWKSHKFKSRSTCLSKSLYIKPNKNSVLTVQGNRKNGKNIKSEKNCVRQIERISY